jgi:cyclic beta-1,2-glucan synthetase
MMVRFGTARYKILVENPDGVCRSIAAAAMDGTAILRQPFGLKMQDDGITHHVQVRLG